MIRLPQIPLTISFSGMVTAGRQVAPIDVFFFPPILLRANLEPCVPKAIHAVHARGMSTRAKIKRLREKEKNIFLLPPTAALKSPNPAAEN